MRWPWEPSSTGARGRLALLHAGELNLYPSPAGGFTASCLEQQMLATQCWLLSVSPLYQSVLEAVAQLAQVVLLCTKLVTGSALMATLT